MGEVIETQELKPRNCGQCHNFWFDQQRMGCFAGETKIVTSFNYPDCMNRHCSNYTKGIRGTDMEDRNGNKLEVGQIISMYAQLDCGGNPVRLARVIGFTPQKVRVQCLDVNYTTAKFPRLVTITTEPKSNHSEITIQSYECQYCRFFIEHDIDEEGDCYGLPPLLLERGKDGSEAQHWGRPMVGINDLGCSLFQNIAK